MSRSKHEAGYLESGLTHFLKITWLELRSDLRKHQMKRIEQLRFRRNPQDYLVSLENLLL